MDKVIITAALNGALSPKSLNPNVPQTPQEIAADAIACWNAGAAIVHLHMRDEQGNGSLSKERFAETVKIIKAKAPNVVINLTTSGDLKASDEVRMAHIIELQPEIASFNAGTFNWLPAAVFTNRPEFMEKLGKTMQQYGVKPEMECFDLGHIGAMKYFMEKGFLPTKIPQYQFVLGAQGAAEATVDNLLYFRRQIPADAAWTAFGIGRAHIPIMYAVIALGGNVRVGLEDNLYYAKGDLATNARLVERAVRVVKEATKDIASPDEARQMLGLKGADKVNF
ncbi:MAG: 3-keto-5-aminohexanoate cleavage protein [Treponemataceae bacterium]